MIGRTISHYKILEQIGGGGMGVVYKAEDTKLRRTVALKFLPWELTQNETAKKRFLREARAASSLDHPNICSIHEIDETPDGREFIAMAYYDGISLKERIHRGEMTVREAYEIASSIAEGLAAAHSREIIHRDIKPSNVMITTEGFVKIVDFGLAKLLGSTRVTRTGLTPGTVAYMSPEQATGKDVDARGDVWSFGVTMYEALTGALPFKGDIEHAMVYSILHTDPEPIGSLRSDVPELFASIIAKCLKRDPCERYQNARELSTALADMGVALGWRSTESVRSAVRLGPIVRSRRRRWILAGAGVAVVAAVVFGWVKLKPPPSPYTTKVRLAMLPLENLAGDPITDSWVAGLAELIDDVLQRLSNHHDSMWVVPYGLVLAADLSTPEGARLALGVNRLLTGDIERVGDGFRISFELLDSRSLRRVRFASVDFSLDAAGDLIPRVTSRLAELLGMSRDVLEGQVSVSPSSAAFNNLVAGIGELRSASDAQAIDAAVRSLESAVTLDSTAATAHAALGRAYFHRYEMLQDDAWAERAMSLCRKAVRLDSLDTYVNRTLAYVAYRRGLVAEATASHKRILAVDPRSSIALRAIGDIYRGQRRYSEAEATYRRAIDAKPDFFNGYLHLGLFFKRTDHTEEAIQAYEKVLQLAPNEWYTLNSLGGIYDRRQDWNKAREYYQRSFAARPECESCSNLGTLAYWQQDFDDAAEYFQFAMQYCDSTDYVLWGDLAEASHWSQKYRERSHAFFDRAIRLGEAQRRETPNNAKLLANLSVYYAVTNRPDTARALATEALELTDDNGWVMFVAACTYEAVGDRELALHHLSNAVRHQQSLAQIRTEPLMRDLVQDVRFRELIESTGEPPAAKRTPN